MGERAGSCRAWHSLAMTSQEPGAGLPCPPAPRAGPLLGPAGRRGGLPARIRGSARMCPGFLFALAGLSSRRRSWLLLCGLFRLGIFLNSRVSTIRR